MAISFEYIGHASVYFNLNGLKVITDPWFGEAFHLGEMIAFPPIEIPAQDLLDSVDLIHISHIHRDHFCAKSLSHFDRKTPVLIAKYEDKTFLQLLHNLGFNNVIECSPNGMTVRDVTFSCIPSKPFNGSFDSLVIMEVREGTESCRILLNNDCELNELDYRSLNAQFKYIDLAFVGYTHVSPYPACYEVAGSDPKKLILEEKIKALQHVEVIDRFFAFKYIFPYANGIRIKSFNREIQDYYFNNISDFELLNNPILKNKLVDLNRTASFVWKEALLSSTQKAALNNQTIKNQGLIQTQNPVMTDSYAENLKQFSIEDYKNFLQSYIIRHQENVLKERGNILISIEHGDQGQLHQFLVSREAMSIIQCPQKNSERVDFAIHLHLPKDLLDQVMLGKISIASIYYAFRFKAEYNFLPKSRKEKVHAWF